MWNGMGKKCYDWMAFNARQKKESELNQHPTCFSSRENFSRSTSRSPRISLNVHDCSTSCIWAWKRERANYWQICLYNFMYDFLQALHGLSIFCSFLNNANTSKIIIFIKLSFHDVCPSAVFSSWPQKGLMDYKLMGTLQSCSDKTVAINRRVRWKHVLCGKKVQSWKLILG